jgi:hypothetical protein
MQQLQSSPQSIQGFPTVAVLITREVFSPLQLMGAAVVVVHIFVVSVVGVRGSVMNLVNLTLLRWGGLGFKCSSFKLVWIDRGVVSSPSAAAGLILHDVAAALPD